MLTNKIGRRWAYFGVILGFGASITANIASTVLKETTVALALRVPFAVLWPLFTYVAIEVLVRINWEGSWSHRLVRLVLAGPVGLVAAFVSYLHQHHLMVLAGEPGLAQGFGPLAVDGMLFGMTAALIVTRVRAPGERYASATPTVDALMRKWAIEEAYSDAPVSPAPAEEPSLLKPVSSPPLEQISPGSTADVPPLPSAPPALRAPWDARKVAEMAVDGVSRMDIHNATGASLPMVDRFRKVAKMLQAEPRKEINFRAEKLRPEYVTMMRELVSR